MKLALLKEKKVAVQEYKPKHEGLSPTLDKHGNLVYEVMFVEKPCNPKYGKFDSRGGYIGNIETYDKGLFIYDDDINEDYYRSHRVGRTNLNEYIKKEKFIGERTIASYTIYVLVKDDFVNVKVTLKEYYRFVKTGQVTPEIRERAIEEREMV